MKGAQAARVLEQAQLTFGAIFPMMNLHSHQTRVIVIATASTSSNIGACHKCCKEKSLEITKKCLITKKIKSIDVILPFKSREDNVE